MESGSIYRRMINKRNGCKGEPCSNREETF